MSARYGDGVKDPSGNYYNPVFPEQIQKNYTQADKDILKAYNATTYLDLWPKPEEFPVRKYGAAWTINLPTGSDLQVTFQKSEDIMKKRIPEAILAKPEDFDKVWAVFMADLEKVGVKKMGEQFTQMVKDRVKLWNE